VIQIIGYHYHNTDKDRTMIGAEYVRNTFMESLETLPIDLPAVGAKEKETVMAKDLGIGYPVLVRPGRIQTVEVPDEEAIAKLLAQAGAPGINKPPIDPNLAGVPLKQLKRFDFMLQFCWKETPASVRAKEREKAEASKAEPVEAAQ
jgi:type IV pilus assembly protein PilM